MDELTVILPGIAAISILFIYYLSRPRLPIKINKLFLGILVTELFVMAFESVALLVNNNFRRLNSAELVYIINLLFYSVYLFRSYLFFVFSCMSVKVYLRRGWKKWLVRTPFIIFTLLLLSSVKFGTVFSVIEKHGYIDGPLNFLMPLCAIIYVIISTFIILSRRSRISKLELFGFAGYNGILLMSALLRMFMPRSLMVNLFGLLSIIICYLSFENPDKFISDRGAAFNKKALELVLDESIGQKATYRALGFVLRGYTEERGIYGSEQLDRGVSLIIDYLRKKYHDHLIFYLRNGEFVIFDKEALNIFRIHEELNERFKQPWTTRDTDLYLSVSFVKVGAESNKGSADAIINNMLIALERASNSASGDNEMYDLDTANDIEELMRVKKALENAVDNNRVELFLQPIVRAGTGEVVGAEALARVRDDNGSIISPASFIPVAEKSGYINFMGEQIFSKVCQFVNSNGYGKTGIEFVNVNLSPIQCMRTDLSERFIGILKKYHADPDRIHLEITEQSMGDSEVIMKQVLNLKNAGFKFALDDYGSGYSNLTRLKYYPFSNVKFDMEVVKSYCRTKDRFVPSIMNVLKQLGYTVTAEGIETKDMESDMIALGCDFLQGFLYSPPIPADDFVKKYTIRKTD